MMNKLKHYREQKLMTQDDLAQLVEVTRQTINRIENGHCRPHLHLIKRLARILKVQPAELELR
jgi:putative transcriptional regulator